MTARLPKSVYLGESRVLTFLVSGEAVVVDTKSLDSLNYIMGMRIEQDVTPLFQSLLKFNSVFIDVGANVGYYTLRAASRIARHGKVFSFEANPHTFDLLQRSLYANSLFEHPNVRAYNCIVHNAAGMMDLLFSPKRLGGASVWHSKDAPDLTRVSVSCARLDDLIPRDVIVDLVKIDVEGNEPYVIRGMPNIIDRSPNIKIIVEFFETFLKAHGGVIQFQSEIAALGLKMWRIHDLGRLTPCPLDVPLTGENYCLLARSLNDVTGNPNEIVIDPEGLDVRPVYRDGANRIVQGRRIVYRKELFPTVRDQDDERVLFYGGYLRLEPGNYELRIDGRVDGCFILRIQYDFGRTVAGTVDLRSVDQSFPFVLTEAADKFEVAVWRTSDSRVLEIDRIVLRKL